MLEKIKEMVAEQLNVEAASLTAETSFKEALGADSLALFEEGTKLVSLCSGMLDNAQQQIMKLRKGPDGQLEEAPFEEDVQQ